MADIEVGDDLLDGADDTPIELTFEQKLSKRSLRELQQEAKSRGLSGAGRQTELIERIVRYEENGGVVPDSADLVGVAAPPAALPQPQQTAPAAAPAAPAAPQAPAGGAASAPAGPPPPATPKKQKVGFFPERNTWRSEFPVGTRHIDDSTHVALIDATQDDAVKHGYRLRGGENARGAGMRIGFSNDPNGMRTVIYEVFAREVE